MGVNKSWVVEPLRFVENLLGDVIFIGLDVAWSIFDRFDKNSVWKWEDEKECGE